MPPCRTQDQLLSSYPMQSIRSPAAHLKRSRHHKAPKTVSFFSQTKRIAFLGRGTWEQSPRVPFHLTVYHTMVTVGRVANGNTEREKREREGGHAVRRVHAVSMPEPCTPRHATPTEVRKR